jgi:hypothetical protein
METDTRQATHEVSNTAPERCRDKRISALGANQPELLTQLLDHERDLLKFLVESSAPPLVKVSR